MADLLPCPFCGSTNLRYEFAGSQGYIECNECGTEGPCDERAADPYCDDDAACDAWNRRAAALADGPAVPDGREPASVTGQPSDEELLGIACQSIEPYDKIRPGEYEAENGCAIHVYGSELVTFARAVLARWGNPAPLPPAEPTVPTVMEIIELSSETEAAGLGQVDFARALLARWGNLKARVTSSTPADGEVAELVARLSAIRNDYGLRHSADCQRAADLLQRLSPPQPVPVSERLPGPEDCDAEGRCWWGRNESDDWSADWTLATHEAVAEFCEFCPRTVWLPAHALPLPSGEVEE